MEKALLGAVLITEGGCFESVAEIVVTPEVLFYASNRAIWQAMQSLHESGQPIELLTLNNQLRTDGTLADVGGSYYLTELSLAVSTAANVLHHARLLYEKYMKRRLLLVGMKLAQDASSVEANAFDLLDGAQGELDALKLGTEAVIGGEDEIAQRVDIAAEMVTTMLDPDHTQTLRTGLQSLDMMIGGLRPQELITLAGRPGSGKSAAMISAAMNIAGLTPSIGIEAPQPVAIIELEMARVQTWCRMVAAITGLDLKRFDTPGNIWYWSEETAIKEALGAIAASPLLVDTAGGYTMASLGLRITRLVERYGIRAAFIDYSEHIILPKGYSVTDEVGVLFKFLKRLAKTLRIPIIIGHQLNRQCEERKTPAPILSDLRNSGSVEQDSDIVLFCYRPEYYNPHNSPQGVRFHDNPQEDILGKGDIIVAKNRNGPTGGCRLSYRKHIARWDNLAP